ncbi:MAG: DegT/DnrJ/EryC1/StrS family aminotransferase [Planctomycetota bacterium]
MKRCVSDLALFGGPPTFAEALHVGRPNIGNRERLLERINDILDRRWLSNNGPYVQSFEEALAAHVGVRHCVAMCNATVALEIAIRALGMRGEVIIPSNTFVATAHALQWQEIAPVFCDIDPLTGNIDPHLIERMITPRTTGIVGVHLWGRPCDVEAIESVARRNGLKLLFDASHAFGCTYRGKKIGNFGDAEVFSFHATKFITSFEGGAIVTNNRDLARRARLMKNFGFAGYDRVIYIGTNGKMTEVSAAMGLTSLESFSEFLAVNRTNFILYRLALEAIPGLHLLPYDEEEECNYQYIVVDVDESATHISRDRLLEVLTAEKVLARRYFYPGCHQMEPYRSTFPHSGLLLPHTERMLRRVLLLPTGTAITESEIEGISGLLRFAVENARDINERLDAGVFGESAARQSFAGEEVWR